MIATRHGDTVTISNDISKALAGFNGGYKVTLHGKPKLRFIVDAGSIDQAQAIALKAVQAEGYCKKVTGATIQAR